MIAYYKCADIFLCMSEHEGFCIPLIEAMYFGVPVIAYDAAAVKDTLGDAGLLFRSKDPKLIGTAIDRLMNDAFLKSVIIEGQYARLSEINNGAAEDGFIKYIRGL